jgi:hypothetical protein
MGIDLELSATPALQGVHVLLISILIPAAWFAIAITLVCLCRIAAASDAYARTPCDSYEPIRLRLRSDGGLLVASTGRRGPHGLVPGARPATARRRRLATHY